MKVSIDASLMSDDGRLVGMISGTVSLPCPPSVGSSISFSSPKTSASWPVVEGLFRTFKISSVTLTANNETDGILVGLEDIVVPTREDGLKVAAFFQEGFDLFWDEFEST